MPSKLANLFVRMVINSPFHSIFGNEMGIVEISGKKTGSLYSLPVNVVRDGEVFTITSLRSRTWWRNLRGGKSVNLTVAGKRHRVYGIVIESPEKVTSDLKSFFIRHPRYAKYFNIRFAADGQPLAQDLQMAAIEHVVIKLYPAVVQ